MPESAVLDQIEFDLEERSSTAVARAARKVIDLGLTDLAPQLLKALSRWLREPAKNDPGCRARTLLMSALLQQEHRDPDIYLQALALPSARTVKTGRAAKASPSGNDGTGELRGLAAMGLAGSHYEHAADFAVDLLVDPDPTVRVFAVRALTIRRESAAIRLLALGEQAPSVLGECLESLLQLEGGRVVGFVADYLHKSPEIAEIAALALGSSRRAEAFAPLRAEWGTLFDRRTLLVAMATLRSPEAVEFLERFVRTQAEREDLDTLRPFGFG